MGDKKKGQEVTIEVAPALIRVKPEMVDAPKYEPPDNRAARRRRAREQKEE